jgi:hypothetical protein
MKNDMNKTITKLVAYVAVDHDGSEGIISMRMGDFMAPMIGADTERIRSLYPIALGIANIEGLKFKVLEFELARDVTEETKQEYDPYH